MIFVSSPLPNPIQPRDSDSDNNTPSPSLLTCYHPNGDPAPFHTPCSDPNLSNPDTPLSSFTFCCPTTHTCSTNQVCFPPLNLNPSTHEHDLPIRATCTDPTWTSDACPKFCIPNPHTDPPGAVVGLKLCEMKVDSTVYCCNYRNSNDDSTGRESENRTDCACNANSDAELELVSVGIYSSLSRPPSNSGLPAPTPTPSQPSSSPSSNLTFPSSEPSTSSSEAIPIFSPALPHVQRNLYTALLVLGCVWLVSAVVLLLVLAGFRIRAWRWEREAQRRESGVSSFLSRGFGDGDGAAGRRQTWRRRRRGGFWLSPSSGSGSGLGLGGMGWNVEGEGDLSGAYTDTDTDKSRRARTGSFTFPSSNPHSPSYGAWTSHRIGGSTGRRSSASTSASVGSLEVVVEEREEEEEENDGRGVVGLEGTDDEDRDMGMWEDKQGWRGEGEGEGEEVMLEEADIGVAIRMEDCVRVEVK